MSTTTASLFESSLLSTDRWLDAIMSELGWTNRHKAYTALRATLHALRDRLPVDESAEFSSQLPLLIRGIYYEGWDPHPRPAKVRHKEDFLERVHAAFKHDRELDPERVVCAVFKTIAEQVSTGEIEDIRQVLPAQLGELWPDVILPRLRRKRSSLRASLRDSGLRH